MTEKATKDIRLRSARGDLLLSIVYSLYRTLREKDRWPAILQQIQELLSAQTCSLSLHDFGSREGTIAVHSGCFDEHHLALYDQIFCRIDPWLSREEHYRTAGASWIGDELVPQAQLVTTRFYREWMRPQGLMHHCTGILFRENSHMVHLTSYRSGREEPFDRSTLYPLQRLLPHIRQTLELQEMFIQVQSHQSHSFDELVRRLGATTIILDAERRLLAASEQAEQMLESGGPLRLSQGRIEADTSELTEKLQALCDAAILTAEGEGTSAGGTIPFGEYQDPSAVIKVTPLPPDSIPGQTQPAVYVTINDRPLPAKRVGKEPRRWLPLLLNTSDEEQAGPDSASGSAPAEPPNAAESNDEKLRRLYNLTRSEAKLAEMLASGHALPSAARQLGIGLNTVRTHLQRIYSKTDTHHQSDLVALLLTGPAHLQVEYHRMSGEGACHDESDPGRHLGADRRPEMRVAAMPKSAALHRVNDPVGTTLHKPRGR